MLDIGMYRWCVFNASVSLFCALFCIFIMQKRTRKALKLIIWVFKAIFRLFKGIKLDLIG
ncbi:hypothetical protein AW064_17925 [Escherichia coli]|nr:hypothetical protein AW064_17925 [Escherichia coli]OTE32337.1 hypothetical protein AW117_28570 [Escherichia coli]